MINRITGLVWSGNIFIDLPRDIHRPLCLLGNQGRRDAHKTSSRLKINQQGKNNPKQSKCNHPITYFSSWGLSARIIFSHTVISSFEARQLSIPQNPSVLVVCSSWLFSIIERWFLFDVKDAHWLGVVLRQSARSNIEFGRTEAVAVAGPLGQLEFQSILKATPFYVIGWLNENIAKFCRISTSFILISPLASQAGWKIDGLHNSEMHLFDLDLCFGLKIQGNTSSPFFFAS